MVAGSGDRAVGEGDPSPAAQAQWTMAGTHTPLRGADAPHPGDWEPATTPLPPSEPLTPALQPPQLPVCPLYLPGPRDRADP